MTHTVCECGCCCCILSIFLSYCVTIVQSYGKWYLFSLKDSQQLTLLQQHKYEILFNLFMLVARHTLGNVCTPKRKWLVKEENKFFSRVKVAKFSVVCIFD